MYFILHTITLTPCNSEKWFILCYEEFILIPEMRRRITQLLPVLPHTSGCECDFRGIWREIQYHQWISLLHSDSKNTSMKAWSLKTALITPIKPVRICDMNRWPNIMRSPGETHSSAFSELISEASSFTRTCFLSSCFPRASEARPHPLVQTVIIKQNLRLCLE